MCLFGWLVSWLVSFTFLSPSGFWKPLALLKISEGQEGAVPENGQLEPLEFKEWRVKFNRHLVEAESPAALDYV